MVRNIISLIAVSAASLLAAPAFAEETLTFADCTDKGCRCTASAVSMEQAAIVLGVPAPPGTVTLVRLNGEYIWSPMSFREIDLVAGGDGECKAELDSPMVPKDGKWIGTVNNQ